jgi:hypothetical protein
MFEVCVIPTLILQIAQADAGSVADVLLLAALTASISNYNIHKSREELC